jgi:DNA-directed RNA polymerase specialized sigma24 family protein
MSDCDSFADDPGPSPAVTPPEGLMVLEPYEDEEPTVARGLEDLERYETEARLLALARVDDRARNRLRDALMGNAMPVLKKWIRSGQMWKEAARVGVPAPPPDPPPLEPEEIDSLAAEVVARAWRRFTDHGLHTWTPTAGRALSTWFVEDCKHQFSNAVRAWSTDRRGLTPRSQCLLGLDDANLDAVPHEPAFGPGRPVTLESDDVIYKVDLERVLEEIEGRLGVQARKIFVGHVVEGYALAEIGRRLGLTRQKTAQIFQRCKEIVQGSWGER